MQLRRWTLLMLLICLITPMTFGQLLTPEEIDSMIQPEMLYQGSDVRDALKEIIAAAQAEIKRASEEAVRAAVAPLLGKIEEQDIIIKGQRREIIRAKVGGALKIIGSLGVGFAAGVLTESLIP